MKNKKILACLLTGLCCFQLGAGIPISEKDNRTAEIISDDELYEIDLEYQEIAGQIQEYINQYITDDTAVPFFARTRAESLYKNSADKFSGFYIRVLASTQENADKIAEFCDEKGFSEKYNMGYAITYPADDSERLALQKIAKQIYQFIDENSCPASVSVKDVISSDNRFIVEGFNILVEAETEKALLSIKAYCEEQGFTKEHTLEFHSSEEETGDNEEQGTLDEEATIRVELAAGNVNFDEYVDILDVITINKVILGKETFNTVQNKLADVNRDGKVNASDSLALLKQIVGIH